LEGTYWASAGPGMTLDKFEKHLKTPVHQKNLKKRLQEVR
jgi:hypothetical protein